MIKTTSILSKNEIRSLRTKSSLMGMVLVIHAWLTIALTMAAYVILPVWWVLLVGVFIVGARQLGLAILMHDASHGLLSPNQKLNNFVGNVFCAWAAGLTLESYRPYHMRHHRFTQTKDDPDLILSSPFPIDKASLYRKILRDLTGLTFLRLRLIQLKQALGTSKMTPAERTKHFVEEMGGIFALNISLWLTCYSLGVGEVYFLLWLLPLATTYQLVARIRNIAEHAVVPDDDDDFRNTRTTKANLLERIFIAPYWVNYHIEHHLFMFTPCYNLPKAHKIMAKKNLLDKMEIRRGYLEVLKLATSKK